MATQSIPTPSQLAYAETLLSRSRTWTRGRRKSDGLSFVVFESSRTNPDGTKRGYYTRGDGQACTCKSWLYRGECSHAIAVRRDVERARAESDRPRLKTLSELYDSHLVDAF